MTSTYAAMIRRFSSPQVAKVLDHLMAYGKITNVAAQNYRIRALPRRIADLEALIRFVNAPVRVSREWKRDLEGQRYIEYSLTEVRS